MFLFTSKFLVNVSLSEYISLTKHQKAFIFEPWVPERVSFYAMSFGPGIDAPGWRVKSKSRTLFKYFFELYLEDYLMYKHDTLE